MAKGAILLVEDSRDVRAVVAEIVSMFGYEVTLAEDGNEAWKKLSSRNFDLVISDMGLPNMGGEELVRKMRIENIKIPAILIAGIDVKKGKTRVDRIANCSFIQKPFDIDELRDKIARGLRSKEQSKKTEKKNKAK